MNTTSQLHGIPVALDTFCERAGINRVTAWHWRRKGWLKVHSICGRLYITPEALESFNRRLAAGEFDNHRRFKELKNQKQKPG